VVSFLIDDYSIHLQNFAFSNPNGNDLSWFFKNNAAILKAFTDYSKGIIDTKVFSIPKFENIDFPNSILKISERYIQLSSDVTIH
jgi:hypothetical protein